jgi:hypothetical protein
MEVFMFHSMVYKRDIYPIVVEFEKALTKGVLNGLTVTDKVHFPSEQEAKLWIDAVSKLSKDGKYFNFKMKAA